MGQNRSGQPVTSQGAWAILVLYSNGVISIRAKPQHIKNVTTLEVLVYVDHLRKLYMVGLPSLGLRYSLKLPECNIVSSGYYHILFTDSS